MLTFCLVSNFFALSFFLFMLLICQSSSYYSSKVSLYFFVPFSFCCDTDIGSQKSEELGGGEDGNGWERVGWDGRQG